ncbi:FAD-dependent oxidoreductase [Lentzea aerocolonigenes]|uniref:FAD-dependent oxidoreductase n=1 Tax=Lentzea aerocolonigenes TaxID=68170 RepID=A0A0F0GE56_LENAE|nr:NAD(P)/FAD-dependent oxidoreductase [Lentzea aerocolonigenes]KJK33567.1 FAD-dependent oxidoreductase [Lentzea aerocolonigenes]
MSAGESYVRSQVGDAWDAIVIGSGIGGLAAAGFLARDGRRVLVLERHTTAGGCTQVFRRAGYEWDAGLHYMGEVHRPDSRLRQIFDHITGGALEWAPMPEIYNRFFIGDREYAIPAGVSKFAESLKGYFPEESRAVDAYLDLVFETARAAKTFFANRALPPALAETTYAQMCEPFLVQADRTVTDVLSELTEDQELIAVLCGHFGDYSLEPWRASFGMHAMLIQHYLDGANFPVGGSGRIAETVAEVVRAAGGAVLIGAEVASIIIGADGAAQGVTMADGRRFTAPVVISDAGIAATVNRLLPAEVAQRSGLADRCRTMESSLGWVVLNIGIKESTSDLGLDGTNIWAHGGADLKARVAAHQADPHGEPMPVYFLSFPSAKDPSWEQRYPGRTTIDICGLTTWSLFEPFAGTRWMGRGEEYDKLKDRLIEEMLGQVLRFCPQLAGKIDHVELATPMSFNHFLGRTTGDFMGMAHTPERFRQRWISAHTPVPGLYFSGQDVVSAGVSGAMVGGATAAAAVLGRNVLEELATSR